jgi:hypothetical protein
MSDLVDRPVVFKRKPKPSQRARERSPTEERASEDVENPQDSPVTSAAQLKLLKSKRTKVKSKLSFGAEDEVRVSTASQGCMLTGVRVGAVGRRATGSCSR